MKYFTKNVFAFLLAMTFVGMTSSLMAQTPFFSEDFDGGLPADWTATEIQGDGMTASNWMWTDVGPTGAFAAPALNGATAANGWMVFDSDLNCSGAQEVRLASPVIDASDKTSVFIEYSNLYRKFRDQIFLETTTDGVTWESTLLNQDIADGDFSDGPGLLNPHILFFDITDAAAGSATFQFAFRFLSDESTAGTTYPGCGYSWQIDDVSLYEDSPAPAVEFGLTEYAVYSPASFAQPIEHAATDILVFEAEVVNNGSEDLTNVVVRATVSDAGGGLLYADSIVYEVLAAGTADTAEMATTFLPDLPIGEYTIIYETYSQDVEDPNPGDNIRGELFTVTEDTWSKNAETTLTTTTIDPTDLTIANVYNASIDLMPNTFEFGQITIASAVDAADGELAGRSANLFVAKLDEDVAPQFQGFDVNSDLTTNDALELVAFVPYTYPDNELLHTVDVTDFDGNAVMIEPGATYLIGVQYSGDDNVIRHGYSNAIDYLFAWRNTVLYVDGDQWYNVGFGSETSATVVTSQRMVTSTEDTPLPVEALNVFPSPTSESISLEVDLENTGKANIVFADMTGRIMGINEYDNLNNGTYSFDVSNYPNGVYMARLVTGDGSRTVKFTVQH